MGKDKEKSIAEIKAIIIELNVCETAISNEPCIRMKFALPEPELLHGRQIDYIHSMASNFPDWNRSLRRAQLINATTGLRLIAPTSEKEREIGFMVPILSQEDTTKMLGIEVTLGVVLEEFEQGWIHLRVIYILPYTFHPPEDEV